MKENKIYYPLTHPQKGIWYTEKFYPDTGISNIAGTLTFTNGVDYPILQKAINMFIKNNDGMRLKVLEDAFGAHQFVNDHEDKDFVFKDFSAKGGWEGLLEWINLECKIPINPINSDLYVFVIIKISDNEGGFFVKAHHAIVDAWTMILIGNQISDYYFKIKEGNTAEINQLPSYLDYIKTESDYEKSPEFLESRAFWLNKFNTIPKITTLKPSKPLFASCEAARKTFAFSKELTCRLEQYSEKSSISIFVILLSIMVIYLHRVLNKDDIVIGTPLFNRPTMKEKLTIGMFIETIPVFLHIDNQLDFGTFIRQTSVEWKQMRRHRYPYSLLLEEIRKNQKLTSNLYDIMFDYQNVKFDLAQSIKPRAYFSGSEANSLCIHISDRENIGQLYFDIDYQVDLFNDLEIEKIFSHFSTILQDALESPSKKIYELEIIEATEKNYLLKELNDTSMVFDREKTIHQLFEEQAEKTPHNFAVIFENKKLTYKQLNNHANNLANILRSKGIGPGDIVGLLGSRSIELGALILGILKAGAAFLLLDPNYPLNRINLILQDSGSKLLLTQANLNKGLFYSPVINIEDIPIDGPGNANPTNNNKPSDLAYIIYTSGSTGKPKGVMIEHKSMCSFFAAMAKQLNLAGKIVLSVTTVTFDIFMFEILLP